MEDATHDIDNENTHQDTNQREYQSERRGSNRRTIAKALINSLPGHGNAHTAKPSKAHPKIEELVNTIVFSLSKESLQYLKGPEGGAALADIIALLAHAVSRFVVTEEARHAIRLTAQEATTGLYDGLGFKAQELATKVPRFVLCLGVVVVGAYGVLLALGFLLCLWRFSLYGLAQEKPASLW